MRSSGGRQAMNGRNPGGGKTMRATRRNPSRRAEDDLLLYGGVALLAILGYGVYREIQGIGAVGQGAGNAIAATGQGIGGALGNTGQAAGQTLSAVGGGLSGLLGGIGGGIGGAVQGAENGLGSIGQGLAGGPASWFRNGL